MWITERKSTHLTVLKGLASMVKRVVSVYNLLAYRQSNVETLVRNDTTLRFEFRVC